MQKRWVAGFIFVTGFLVGFIWVMILSLGNIIDYYKLAFEFDTHEPNPVSPSAFIAPLLIAAVFHLVNLFDVFSAQQRMNSKRAREEFMRKNKLPL